MGWRVALIGNPARLRVETEQLVVAQDEECTLPIEDLAALVLESPEVTITSALLARLAAADVLVLTCNEKHLPNGALLPTAAHHRLLKVQRAQLSTALPFRKRCWQLVVRQKILNQAECLRLLGRNGAEDIARLAPLVTSGDEGNVEARAARMYFRRLYGARFIRGNEDAANAALDYGYAIARAALARALAAHGLLPAHGIHHEGELNPFNLADDFIEPLRPLVDLVAEPLMADQESFERIHRVTLVMLLGCDVVIKKQRHPMLHATEVMAAAFAAACQSRRPAALILPSLLPVAPHRYE